MRRAIRYLVLLGVLAAIVMWWLTAPARVDRAVFADLTGDAARGERVFWVSGCASCHAAPKAEGAERLILSGGMAFPSPFGTFYAPNISSDPQYGIGNWTVVQLADAMVHGTSPEGAHYYPAFPYTSYGRAMPGDIADIHAFLQTLPASDQASLAHDVGFPFNIRRGLGVWKLLFPAPSRVIDVAGDPASQGQYLVEGLGHCGECHTPRGALGQLDYSQWMAGAPAPDGKGKVPALTPDKLTWSDRDVTAYLSTGFTPEYDSAGGHMADVVQNLAHLPESDLQAITAYLRVLPVNN
ncbi:cytochrome c [Alisedimentitalea sp. MJ-SS2]|uniref:cytochrome c n=1 Tax=Aliisedimentitalea sp. MJ-SS2 TaxID=3049795 RepID=UPI00291332ED|nr:cytochrome c [Alisedimentitalea sp. MJ-SS2]MDU8929705.1 cytochrome c [Alisedimentitalea sp. MJ-SS2]